MIRAMQRTPLGHCALGQAPRRRFVRAAPALASLAAVSGAMAQDLPAPWRSVQVPSGTRPIGPAVCATADGAYVTWLERGPEMARDATPSPAALRLARFAKGTIDAPERVRAGDDFFANWADFAAACVAPNGDLLVACLVRGGAGYDYDIRLFRRDAERGFVDIGTPYGDDGRGGQHGFVSMLPEGDDGVRLFWLDGRAYENDKRMQLRSALVRGGAVADERVLDPDVCSCCQTGASLVDGEPMLVYRGHDAGEIRDIRWVRRTRDGWTAPRNVATDGWEMPGCPVNGPAIAAVGARAAVAWYTAADGEARVRLAFTSGEGAFAAPFEVDKASPVGRVDVVAGDDGALVSWLASDGADALLCAQAWTPAGKAGPRQQLARVAMGRSSGFPRLRRVGDALLLVWLDVEAGCLRAATAGVAGVLAVK